MPSKRAFRILPGCLGLWLFLTAAPAEPGGPPPASNRAMARELRALFDAFDVPQHSYANSRRVAFFRQAIADGLDILVELRYRYYLIDELLNAGELEEAIYESKLLFTVLIRNREHVEDAFLVDVWRLHGMAYLRQAEVINCTRNHTAESCLFPIAGGGVHRFQQPSMEAVRVFRALLEDFPDDLAARYLLNVAYMTLGEYPRSVPERFLIPPEAFAGAIAFPRFRDIAGNLGVAVNRHSGGVVMDDLNGDGLLDLLVSSFGLNHPMDCFLNRGDGAFENHTDASWLGDMTGGLNLVHADYDNDGDVDIFVLRGGWERQYGEQPNSLLRNDGQARFTDVTRAAGLYEKSPTQTAAWGDFNNDGLLDLFVGNESLVGPGFAYGVAVPGAGAGDLHPCRLYLNAGDGAFREAGTAAGVDFVGYIKGVAAGDYNNDGRLDLFLSNMQGDNALFENRGNGEDGVPRFRNVAAAAGVQAPRECFPAWFFDYDNDGWLDLFVAGYSASRLGMEAVAVEAARDLLGRERESERLWLYRNNRDGTFTDVAAGTPLDTLAYVMGANFGDLDADGWLDLYLGTGEPSLQAIIPNRMFRNDGGRGFVDVTTAGGFGHLQKGHGIAFGDIDHDGDQDIYAVMGGVAENDFYPNVLFRNPGNGHRFLVLKLEGTTSNRSAIGAVIRVSVDTADGPREVYKSVNTGGSFGASPLRQHIGLGRASAIRELAVRWPGATAWTPVGNVALDHAYRIREGDTTPQPMEYEAFPLTGAGAPTHKHHHHP